MTATQIAHSGPQGLLLDPDRDTVLAMAAGSVNALAELYARHCVLAYSIALTITRDRSIVEDATQDAFLAVWRSAGNYVEARGSVKTWLLAIVQLRSVDIVRRQRRARERPGEGTVTTAQATW